MPYSSFIKPKDYKIGSRTFALSRIPAFDAQMSIYPEVARVISGGGALGVTRLPAMIVKQILAYTAVRLEDGTWRELDSENVINDTFDDIADMHTLLCAQVAENFGFLTDGRLLKVLGLKEAEAEESVS